MQYAEYGAVNGLWGTRLRSGWWLWESAGVCCMTVQQRRGAADPSSSVTLQQRIEGSARRASCLECRHFGCPSGPYRNCAHPPTAVSSARSRAALPTFRCRWPPPSPVQTRSCSAPPKYPVRGTSGTCCLPRRRLWFRAGRTGEGAPTNGRTGQSRLCSPCAGTHGPDGMFMCVCVCMCVCV